MSCTSTSGLMNDDDTVTELCGEDLVRHLSNALRMRRLARHRRHHSSTTSLLLLAPDCLFSVERSIQSVNDRADKETD